MSDICTCFNRSANFSCPQVPHGASGPLHAGITTVPMQPIPVMQHQLLPGQQTYLGGAGGGNYTAGQQPIIMPMAGGGAGGGIPPGMPVLLNGGPAPQMPGNYPGGVMMAPGQFGGMAGPSYGAEDPQLNEPQDFKPADPNPSRMYQVRQLDNKYVPMSRATIDSFGPGARWFCKDDGVFYAVRLDA